VASLLASAGGELLACDFLTVETAFLQRIYVLFFISLATRGIEYVACTSNPDGRWITQQARKLIMHLGSAAVPLSRRRPRHEVHAGLRATAAAGTTRNR
jgi:hypothetical protein